MDRERPTTRGDTRSLLAVLDRLPAPDLRDEIEARVADPFPLIERTARPSRRGRLITAAAMMLIALVAFSFGRLLSDDAGRNISSPVTGWATSGVIDLPDLRDDRTTLAVASGRRLWVSQPGRNRVDLVERSRSKIAVLSSFEVASVAAIAASGGVGFALAGNGDVMKLQVGAPAERVAEIGPLASGRGNLVAASGSLWASVALDGDLRRIDLEDLSIHTVPVPISVDQLAAAGDAVWAVGTSDRQAVVVDPTTAQVGPPMSIGIARTITADRSGLWTVDPVSHTVGVVAIGTGKRGHTATVTDSTTSLALAGGLTWSYDRRVLQGFDRAGRVQATLLLTEPGTGIGGAPQLPLDSGVIAGSGDQLWAVDGARGQVSLFLPRTPSSSGNSDR